MNMAGHIFPSWRSCDAQSMLKASGALIEGRVDHRVFADWMVMSENKAKASATVPATPRRSCTRMSSGSFSSPGKALSSPRTADGTRSSPRLAVGSPRISQSGGSSYRASPGAASSQAGNTPRAASSAAGCRSTQASAGSRLGVATQTSEMVFSPKTTTKLRKFKMSGGNEQQAQACSACESQNAEPEPEERAGLEQLTMASSRLSITARSKVSGKEATLPTSPADTSVSTPRMRPGFTSPTGDGSRLEKAQARHAASIEHLRSVSDLVNALEIENARLRARVRELESGKTDGVGCSRNKRSPTMTRKTIPHQSRLSSA